MCYQPLRSATACSAVIAEMVLQIGSLLRSMQLG